MENPQTLESAVRQYEKLRPNYERFSAKLSSTLSELFASENLPVVLIESRAKAADSFREKLARPGKRYVSPLEEITDLCGIRIITYTIDAVELICRSIEKEMDIDLSNSIDKGKELAPNEFGYLSRHYVVQLSPARLALPEYAAFRGLRAEIQVRTVLQHAWAAIDHRLRYKGGSDTPIDLVRRLYCLSGLLELADREFDALDGSSKVHKEVVAEKISRSDLNIPIDSDSLRSFIDGSSAATQLESIALESGFGVSELDDESDYKTLAAIAEACRQANITSLLQLENEFIEFIPKARKYYSAAQKATNGIGWNGNKRFFILLATFCISANYTDLRSLLRGWSPWLTELVVETVNLMRE